MQIGIIALQGDVSEHIDVMKKSLKGTDLVVQIRRAGIVPLCQGLVLPGGESTTISRQLESTGIANEIKMAASAGKPVLATCAGLVLVAKEIEGNSSVKPLELIDIKVGRNIFGPQRNSFEADLDVKGFDKPYKAVFIRAPGIVNAGPDVDILASIGDFAVAARQGNVLCLAFHPELTVDLRFHQLFFKMMRQAKET
ncbi:MAG: pyridoxal 5'-phosphate synthase glutaminase subunit PdxT [Methanotrichaceae archaeon]|nr:pyridoxal 5'-phosphate synthase glutaminase subunit PdxT [Methanotrichaceae archaeon]